MIFDDPKYLNDKKNGLEIFKIKEYTVLCKRIDTGLYFSVRMPAYSEIDAENRVWDLITDNKFQHQYIVEAGMLDWGDRIFKAQYCSRAGYTETKEAVSKIIHDMTNHAIARIARIDLGLEG